MDFTDGELYDMSHTYKIYYSIFTRFSPKDVDFIGFSPPLLRE